MAGTRGRRFVEGWRWMPPFRADGVSPVSGPGNFYVFLVVVALLFCHGAFGYAHQVPPVDVQTAHVAHVAGSHQPDSDQGTDRLHPGDAYFAILLALFLGAFLLLGVGGSAGARLPASTLSKGVHKVRVLHPPRAPTLPSLQVFQL
ncbi:MAG: hypothetical protein WKF95_01975 [Rubrobacter sp.]